MISDDVLAELAHRAAWLSERLTSTDANEEPIIDRAAGDKRIKQWCHAVAGGDADFFQRRLEWDGIPLEHALLALARVPPSAPPVQLPEWTEWLRAVAELCASDGEVVLSDPADAELSRLPFGELYRPYVKLGGAILRDAVAVDEMASSLALITSCELELSRQLSRQAELALFEYFRSGVWAASSQDAGNYTRFIEYCRASSMVGFFREYPVLARHFALIMNHWSAASRELVERVGTDRSLLCERFASGSAIGAIVSAKVALSDPHAGGRRVALLEFENGVQIVYKPRDCGLEAFYNSFLRHLGSQGFDWAPPSIEVCARDGYGWVSFAAPGALDSKAQVETFFRRAGALIAIAHVVGGRDLHMENVVATAWGPVVIDAEMFFQPVTSSPSEADSEEPATASAEDSVLSSGLVHWIQTDPHGGVSDIGGLFGTRSNEGALTVRRWSHLGTDQIEFDDVVPLGPEVHNRIVFDERLVNPDDYSELVVEGFRYAYKYLEAHRGDLVVDSELGGILAGLARERSRFLLRPTQQYGFLLQQLRTPAFQRDGFKTSLATETIHRSLRQVHHKPALWEAMREEQRSLLDLDVPRFEMRVAQPALVSDGQAVMLDSHRISGADSVARRLMALGPTHLRAQLDELEEALAEGLHTRLPGLIEPSSDTGDADGAALRSLIDEWRDVVEVIADLVVESVDRGGVYSERRQDELYSGAIGSALFLAARYSIEPDETILRVLDNVLGPLMQRLRDSKGLESGNVGIANGTSSLVYALCWIGTLIARPECLRLAESIAEGLSQDRIDEDPYFDLVSGRAGALVALLGLHRATKNRRWLDRAETIGASLVASATSGEREGRRTFSWRNRLGLSYGGFAHGTAGVALALGRLSEELVSERFTDAAIAAQEYERGLYSETLRNWMVPLGGDTVAGGRVMTNWCHGAPGIALSRALLADRITDPDERARMSEELSIAIQSTLSAGLTGVDHLCCGNLGRAGILHDVGRRLNQPVLMDAASELTERVVARAQREGRFRLNASGFKLRVFDFGFFRGLAGIAYELMRLSGPANSLPSVLAFELPGDK